MKTKQDITREIVKDVVLWFVEHKKPLTSRSLKPIIERYITSEVGVKEITNYMSSKEGIRVWHSVMLSSKK